MGRLKEWLENMADDFDPELNCCINPDDRKFNSVLSVVFHKLLKKWFLVVLVVFIISIIVNLIMKTGFVQMILGGALLSVFITIPIFLLFMIMMVFEAFAKQITSLLLYGQISQETYNPIDVFVFYFMIGNK